MHRRHVASVLLASTAALTLFALTPASAAPEADTSPEAAPGPPAPQSLEEMRAVARELRAELDANGSRISALAEELNGAQYRLDQIDREITAAQEGIDEAEAEVEVRRDVVNRRAATAYKHTGNGEALDVINVSDPQERNTRAMYSDAASADDAAVVAELEVAKDELAKRKSEQEAARSEAAEVRDRLAEKTTEIQQANTTQAVLLNSVNGDIRALLDEERAAREALLASLPPGTPPPPLPEIVDIPIAVPPLPDPPPLVPPPASTPRAQIALAFAFGQLGKPYCFGGNGWGRGAPFNCPPGTFDCSGLTMRAWGAAGIAMPQYSGAQYSMFPRVALDKLEPGDLVFYGPGGSQHVGMYIGAAKMVHAPHTGDVVRIAPIFRSSGGPVGAVRPG